MGIRENAALGLAVLTAWTILCAAAELMVALALVGAVDWNLFGARPSLVTVFVVYFDWQFGRAGILAFWPGLDDGAGE